MLVAALSEWRGGKVSGMLKIFQIESEKAMASAATAAAGNGVVDASAAPAAGPDYIRMRCALASEEGDELRLPEYSVAEYKIFLREDGAKAAAYSDSAMGTTVVAPSTAAPLPNTIPAAAAAVTPPREETQRSGPEGLGMEAASASPAVPEMLSVSAAAATSETPPSDGTAVEENKV